jgi:hypothetical protein
MSKNGSSYKDISHKLGWKDQPVPKKYEPPKVDVNTQNPPVTPKTTIKPKSTGNGSEI